MLVPACLSEIASGGRQHRKYGADLAGALNAWQRRHLPTAVAAVRLGPVIGARLGLGGHTAATS